MTDRDLPPTQYLIMEVLAARYRLGEHQWTFPTTLGGSITKLQARKLVSYKNGIVEHTFLVWLTDKGIRAWGLDKPYPDDRSADDFLETLVHVIQERRGIRNPPRARGS